MTLQGDEMITVKEAAKLLGISTRGVIGAIERNRIEAQKFANAWAISRRSVLKYKQTRGHAPGRPKRRQRTKK